MPQTLQPEENKSYSPFILHVSAWVVYTSLIYIANYLANPNVKIINTVLFLLPFCLTFYVSFYFLKINKIKGILSFLPCWHLLGTVTFTFYCLCLACTNLVLETLGSF